MDAHEDPGVHDVTGNVREPRAGARDGARRVADQRELEFVAEQMSRMVVVAPDTLFAPDV
jgi:hypothetical protein